MPGRGSYGPAGKWVHDRAHHIMNKNKETPKSVAYAVAVQQAHKVGKSPKSFRTGSGVRAAKSKYDFPKKEYKKTAAHKLALSRLKRLQKEAEATKREVRFRHKDVRRAPTVKGTMRARTPKQKEVIKVPRGFAAHKRGFLDKLIMGSESGPVRIGKPKSQGPSRLASSLGDALRAYGINSAIPAEKSYMSAVRIPRGHPEVEPAKKLLANSPAARRALKYTGLGGLGVLGAAGAHQLAHSVGLTERGPADTIADIVVPNSKYSYDREATERLLRGNRMYIPRHYLEKAAASMVNATETNEDTMHESTPQMFGPESSIIPQQTLHTSVPISQHVDRTGKESEALLGNLFNRYKSTKGELVGHYAEGETEIPLSKQAGRLAVR